LINGGRVDCFVGEGVDDLGDVEVRFAFRVDLEQLAGSVTEKFVQTDLKKNRLLVSGKLRRQHFSPRYDVNKSFSATLFYKKRNVNKKNCYFKMNIV
jgi:hypothetical protein